MTKRSKGPSRARVLGRRVALGAFCVVFFGLGAAIGNVARSKVGRDVLYRIVTHPYTTITHPTDPLYSYTLDLLPPDKQHVVNVLLLGCDHDYYDDRPVPIMSAPGRSDAILIARFDLDHDNIKVLSIPRDTAVRIPGHGISKINAAHAMGGPALTQETIRRVFGIDTDFYITLNFEGFQQVVDAIGGVDVNVEKPLNYDDNWANLHVHLQPGYQHLNGYKAMGYVRIRHSDDDLHRAQRQQEFLEALKERVKSPSVVGNLPTALDKLAANIKSNLSENQMLALLEWARKVPHDNIALATLPCIEGPSYVYIKVPESEDVIRKMFFDDNLVAVNVDAPNMGSLRSPRRWYDGEPASPRHKRKRARRGEGRRTNAEALPEPDVSVLDGDQGAQVDSGGNTGSADPGSLLGGDAPHGGGDKQPSAPDGGDKGGTSGGGDHPTGGDGDKTVQ